MSVAKLVKTAYILAAMAAAIGSVALLWQARGHLQRSRAIAAAAPYDIGDTEILSVLDSAGPTSAERKPDSKIPFLIIVLKEQCPDCDDALQVIRNVLKRVTPAQYTVILATPEKGPRLTAAEEMLRDAGASVRTLTITDVEGFCVRTGIYTAPTVLAIQPTGRVRVIITGPLTESVLEESLAAVRTGKVDESVYIRRNVGGVGLVDSIISVEAIP
jgi:hypothetical protein